MVEAQDQVPLSSSQIEERYAPAGTVDFLITSRTYEEAEGQPPVYGSALYRWDGVSFTEIRP